MNYLEIHHSYQDRRIVISLDQNIRLIKHYT